MLHKSLFKLQVQNPDSNILNNMTIERFSADAKSPIFTFSVKSKLANKDKVENFFKQLYKQVSDSKELKASANLSIQNMQNRYDEAKENVKEYNTQMKNASDNAVSGDHGALIISYMNMLQNKNALAVQLKTIQPNLQEFGAMTYSKIGKQSKFDIALLGVFLSLVIGFVAVFVKTFVRKLREQLK